MNPAGSEDPGNVNHKVPEWLNDVTLYHNRGDTTYIGENSLYGDFVGLDDLFTEDQRVVDGMKEIYKQWITDFRIDGFRIDTMKHVNDEFWQDFAPDVLAHAKAEGKYEFLMFGEVFDTTKTFTSHFTTHDKVQAVIDFPFQAAAQRFAAASGPTSALRDFFVGDDWYTDADSNVYQLPTFLGNHDMGRIGRFVRQANAGASDDEVFDRDRLAHELMYFSRGNPVIYYGDEQGFVGDGGDQDARQDMFPSDVASYNDDDLIATDATTAESNFDTTHPLYEAIGSLASLTKQHPALRNGPQQSRYSTEGAGIFAFSRLDRRRRPRVRRRAQQLRAGADRVHPDLRRAPRRVQPRLRRRRGHREDGRRPAAGRDRAAAVDGRLPLRRRDPAQRGRAATSRSSRCPTAARGATAPRCARSSTAARSTT